MRLTVCLVVCSLMLSCSKKPEVKIVRDIHSYSNPQQVRIRHVDLDLEVDFAAKVLKGTAALTIERAPGAADAPLILDTRDLAIESVEAGAKVPFEAGPRDPILGSPLTVRLPPGANRVLIRYATSPHSSALQWLEPAQTAGKKHPFLYSQSEAIHARSWIPIQDSPGVRITYAARIRTPAGLKAVMSAEQLPERSADGAFLFRMTNPIPPYLIALAAGDLEFRPMSARTGVWAEPSVAGAAAREFDDTEKMIQAVEAMYGPYRWGRYDILVLPPSFPFGGMENPRLTFATPTVIVGDKSLVSLIAHELAHSWSGNLVTNATWSDFWLNEGFTVYVEQRIQEKVFGRQRSEMEAVLGVEELKRELASLPAKDQQLHIDLAGRDPDDGASEVPYVKGALFLRTIERGAGREKFDAFLRSYFEHFAFQSITTQDFLDYLHAHLSVGLPVDEWINKPGLPSGAALPSSGALQAVADSAALWLKDGRALKDLPTSGWTTQEWVHFIEVLPASLSATRMEELDRAFRLTGSANAEILQPWLLLSIRHGYKSAYPRLEEFLLTVGRQKYIKPLYEELAKSPEGLRMARAIYTKARPGYHAIASTSIDRILKPAP
jgi:leukotriene-A4 hydrolase